jgi:alkanesulfonate monooxygenase SsuD/methylene tetrahydromethanopterin reductase-like flavin-dependent oxidoreductase (luciferase family)
LKAAGEKTRDMNARLDEKGRRPIQISIPGHIFIGKTDEEARSRVVKLTGNKTSLAKSILNRGFVGSPETIVDRIQKLSDLGIDYVIFQVSPALKVLEEIEESLIPLL